LAIFNIFGSNEDVRTPPVSHKTVAMDFVHPDDQSIVDTILSCSYTLPYIAGGACLNWYLNRPTATDIDLYFYSPMQYERFKKEFENSDLFRYHGSYTVQSTSNNALTYRAHDRRIDRSWTVQLVKKNFYPTIESVLDDFDITVCKIGYYSNRVVTRSTFIDDVATKTLRFDNINPQSHKRLVKYMCYGYEPSQTEFEKICLSESIDWTARGDDHYS
jgi:hypothetical protein